MNDFNLGQWLESANRIVREQKLKTLKRWGQEKCECGEPLVTLFNSEGRNPWRVCIKCEDAANDRDYGP